MHDGDPAWIRCVGFVPVRWLSAVMLLTLLSGCQLGYYAHVSHGHMAFMAARTPVSEVLADPALDPQLRDQLQLSRRLLRFAQQELQLPADGVYRDYVALPEPWVVWNLFAAPEFSLVPHQWCYPVVGCAGYRGYFSRQRAERERQRLEAQGLQVFGAGAIAYSTLGWFRDPLTSAMLQGDEAWFAELLFHELVHRRYYLKGDTRFNESLATAVAREGLRRWLARHGDPAVINAVRARDEARARVLALVGETRDALTRLYASRIDEQAMREQRERIIAQLRRDFASALAEQPLLAGWREWFDGPLNNAQLNMVSDYHDLVPQFDAALLGCGGDWPCFWQRVEQMAKARRQVRAEDDR